MIFLEAMEERPQINVCGNGGWFIAYAWIYEAVELGIKIYETIL